MSQLSDSQFARLRRELSEKKVHLPDLYEELVDHLVCWIEEKMNEGADFETAYQQARVAICPDGFAAIESETLLLIRINQPVMLRNVVFISGLLSGSLSCMGWGFKVMHWPWANNLMLMGSFLLLFIFLPLLMWRQIKLRAGQPFLRHLPFVLGALFSFPLGFGAIGQMLHWPGSTDAFALSLIGMALIFLPLLCWTLYRGEGQLTVKQSAD